MTHKIHKVRIETLDQYARAIGVLDRVGGTYQGVGPSSEAYLLLNDAQFNALVEAHVVSANHTEVKKGGKKKSKKKSKS